MKLEITPPPPGPYTLVLMVREWTGSGYVTRDHSNFGDRVTFPLTVPPRPIGGTANTNNAPGAVLNPAQSRDARTAATVAELTGHPGDESESPLGKGAKRAATAPGTENNPLFVLFAELTSFAQWVLRKIRQQLSL